MKITLTCKELTDLVLSHVEDAVGLTAGSLAGRTILVNTPGSDDALNLAEFVDTINVDLTKKK